jgi:hypothetical protein
LAIRSFTDRRRGRSWLVEKNELGIVKERATGDLRHAFEYASRAAEVDVSAEHARQALKGFLLNVKTA